MPLIAAIIWLGIYPAPVLRRTQASAQLLVDRVQGGGSVARVSEVVR
jgi:NADH:ubiquinone oxidoreductase subunit 4 (subunit M)